MQKALVLSKFFNLFFAFIQYHSVCMGNIFQDGFVYLFQAIDVVLGTLQYIRGIFFHILGHNDLQSSLDYVYVDVNNWNDNAGTSNTVKGSRIVTSSNPSFNVACGVI